MRASTGIWASVGDTSTVFKHARRSADCPTAQSRRDDLEALGYMLVYFMRGRLPWQGLKATRDAKYLLVLEKKQATRASELCAGLPTEFVDYFNYVHDLRDEDRPDYQHLRKMFTKLFRRQGFEYDNIFDWTIREFQRLGLDEEPPTSNSVDGRLGVDTTKPWVYDQGDSWKEEMTSST